MNGRAWRKRVFACVLAMACAIAIASPQRALAWFNDVTDSYPALQELPISGDVLTAADIPEGKYSITISCSSYMCKFTNVTLTSVGGELWVTFTLSKAYNALYFGTAEEAAEHTNAEGTDMSSYYVSEPIEGYVARQFSLPIPALNQEITLATYSGGSKGIEGGMWYTRTIVCNSNSEVEKAVANGTSSGGDATNQSDDGDSAGNAGQGDTSQGEDGSDTENDADDDDDDDGADDSQDSTEDENADDDDDDTGDSSTVDEEEDEGDSDVNTATVAAQASSGNSQGGTKSQGSADRDGNAQGQGSSAVPANAKVGQQISIVGDSEVALAAFPEKLSTAELQDVAQDRAAAIAAAVAVCIVNAGLIVAFVLGVRRVRPKSIADE